MPILKKKKPINQTNSCGPVSFLSFSVFFSVFMCLFVYLVSLFCTAALGSQFISLSSNVDFLVTRKYIQSTIQSSSSEVSEKKGKKIKEYVCIIH